MTRWVLSFALGAVITAAAIWYLLTPEILRQLATVAAGASWWMLGLAMLVGAAVQWLRAWRFAMMTTGGFALPRLPLVRIAFQLNFMNFLLPVRLGELSYPVLMRRVYGQPLLSGGGVLLLARIFDLCAVGAILTGMSAALGLASAATAEALLWALCLLLLLAPVALAFGARALARRLDAANGKRKVPAAVRAALTALAPRPTLAAIGLSLAIWLVFGLVAALAAAAVADIPPAVALLGAAASSLAFALPVNGIGGLGPPQAAWVLMVNLAAVPWADAVISALALYAVTLAGALLFGGVAMMAPAARRASQS